ncbi:MAG: beta-lactamase family protein, partial [Lachnospiraceae bacterium]|nr:beta-lactamase family protein [Lachnospiraceae bacterium]
MNKLNEEKLTQYLDSLLDMGVPSVDCMVLRDHQVIYRHTAGTQDADRTVPVSKDQLYLMFSMTKVQTMTAVLSLIEKGKISLDDPVSKFLPAYGHTTVKREDGSTEPGKPILIRHLVSMQSGLDYDLARPGIRRLQEASNGNATTRQIVDSFVETPLLFQPGERFMYSLSHDVAAAVVEFVTGMKFSEYLK